MRKSLKDIKHMVKDVPYPYIMPDKLLPYHYYLLDAGHSIMCVLKCHLKEAQKDMDLYEVPVPVKYVLQKGFEIKNGYIIVDANYDSTLGLMVDEKYYEF